MSDEDGRAYRRDGKLIVPWRLSENLIAPEQEESLQQRVDDGEPGIAGFLEHYREKKKRIKKLGVEVIHLLTPEEFEALPEGTEVISINGKRKIKGQDYIDQDTRAGRLAFGVVPPRD